MVNMSHISVTWLRPRKVCSKSFTVVVKPIAQASDVGAESLGYNVLSPVKTVVVLHVPTGAHNSSLKKVMMISSCMYQTYHLG